MSKLKYIKYSNEKERRDIITHLEDMSFERLRSYCLRNMKDDCIAVDHEFLLWRDENTADAIEMGLKEMKLEIPEEDLFLKYDNSKYTETKSEDGTITLKPKETKRWIVVYCNTHIGEECALVFKDEEESERYTKSIKESQHHNYIETFEREYKI